ncbi:MAG TPA: hypothetical protein VHN98_02810 [Acidimicrobiales bacterium]|nr:hypothetical protein [Acidimicrobiales bacterium]
MALWVIPAAVALVGVFSVIVVLRGTLEEAQRLQSELVRVRELRSPLLELHDDAVRLRSGVADHFDRRA